MYTALNAAKVTLATITGLASCEIGLEANISPADYPLIRLVPSRVTPGKPYAGRTIDTLIYFGVPIANSEGLPLVYQTLSTLEAAIRAKLVILGGRWLETITDEDRLDTYKLMALRCELVEV